MVKLTSEYTEAGLEAEYRKACQERAFGCDDGETAADDPSEFMEDDIHCALAPKDAALTLLETIQKEATLLDQKEVPEDLGLDGVDDPEFAKMSDADDLKRMLEDPETEEQNGESKEHLPHSLLEAMSVPSCKWNALFRFAVMLRSGPGGCDTRWIPHAKNARRTSRTLNWHQLLGRDLAFKHIYTYIHIKITNIYKININKYK